MTRDRREPAVVRARPGRRVEEYVTRALAPLHEVAPDVRPILFVAARVSPPPTPSWPTATSWSPRRSTVAAGSLRVRRRAHVAGARGRPPPPRRSSTTPAAPRRRSRACRRGRADHPRPPVPRLPALLHPPQAGVAAAARCRAGSRRAARRDRAERVRAQERSAPSSACAPERVAVVPHGLPPASPAAPSTRTRSAPATTSTGRSSSTRRSPTPTRTTSCCSTCWPGCGTAPDLQLVLIGGSGLGEEDVVRAINRARAARPGPAHRAGARPPTATACCAARTRSSSPAATRASARRCSRRWPSARR